MGKRKRTDDGEEKKKPKPGDVSQKRKLTVEGGLRIRKLGRAGDDGVSTTFPVALYPRAKGVFRYWAMMSFLRSAETALLMKNWIRGSVLLSGASKYAFSEKQTIIKREFRDKGKTEAFERALHMAVEVLLHLPGGQPIISSLVGGASGVKVVRGRARRQAYSVMFQAFDECCHNRLVPADSVLDTIKKQIGVFASSGNEVYHANFVRGIIAYARWLKAILAVPKRVSSAVNPDEGKVLHFEYAHWAVGDHESTARGKDVQAYLETALEKTPSMPAFYKIAHYYCAVGEPRAALNAAEKAREVFSLDADSHTLFLCLKTSFSEQRNKHKDTSFDSNLCKYHIDILRCNPRCSNAVRRLVELGDQQLKNWEVQVLVIEGLLYRLDLYPVVPIVNKRKDLTPGIDATACDTKSWISLAERLVMVGKASIANYECFNLHWRPMQQLLNLRKKWWKISIFRSVNSFLFDEVMDDDKVNYMLCVAICAVFILGLETDFYPKLYGVLNSNGHVKHTALLQDAKSVVEKLEKMLA